MCGENHLARPRDAEPFRPVDFGKRFLATAAGRPFHGERVALDGMRIAVALKGPCVNDLAALLLDRLEWNEGAGRFQARLLLELPLGGDEQILVGIRFALGDRP